jgi:hypothetical protein
VGWGGYIDDSNSGAIGLEALLIRISPMKSIIWWRIPSSAEFIEV